MNKTIIEVFPVTGDAALIDKHFGKEIDHSPLLAALLKANKEEILLAAKNIEKEEGI